MNSMAYRGAGNSKEIEISRVQSARKIASTLHHRCDSTDRINGKIANAEQMKVHTMLVIGNRDMEANAVSLRVQGKGNLGAKPKAEAIAEILQSIKERRP
jgi:threonyl-tRNA synthetase